jgi:hypothetical protein
VDVDHVPLIQELDQFLDYLTNYPANSSKETLRSMASTVPPRDWTEIRWPDIARPDAARWIAVLPLAATEQHGPHLPLETDVLIGEAYLARVRELLPAHCPSPFCRCSRSAFPPNISIIRAR